MTLKRITHCIHYSSHSAFGEQIPCRFVDRQFMENMLHKHQNTGQFILMTDNLGTLF